VIGKGKVLINELVMIGDIRISFIGIVRRAFSKTTKWEGQIPIVNV
jgi:hypothetical protein